MTKRSLIKRLNRDKATILYPDLLNEYSDNEELPEYLVEACLEDKIEDEVSKFRFSTPSNQIKNLNKNTITNVTYE